MGRKILFITTDQQRYDTLGCNGGTIARTPVIDALAAAGHPLRAGPPADGRVHAVAQHDAHRPAPEHPRRVDERRAAARGRAVGRRGAARRRLSHRDHRQAALRAVPRPVRPLRRERLRPRRHVRPAPRLRALRVGDPRRRRPAALRPLAGRRRTPRRSACSTRCSTARSRSTRWAAATPARRRCTTTHPPRVVPHRLGGRSHDLVARLARRRRRLVLLDELPRSAPPVGSAGSPRSVASTGATCRCPPATSPTQPSASACSTPSRATGGRGTTARWSATTRRRCDWVPATLTADQVREVNALQRGRVRADRRGDRAGAGRHRRAGLGRRRRRRLHDRPRRAAGRLRAAVQGPVPRRRADAAAAHLAAGAVRRRRAASVVTARSASSTWRPTFCAIAGLPAPAWMEGKALPVDDADADARGFERVLDRVGQRAVRRRRAPAHDHPRRLGVHHVPARHGARRHRGRAVRPDRRSVAAGQPVGRPGAARRCAAIWSPTCGITSR